MNVSWKKWSVCKERLCISEAGSICALFPVFIYPF
uniref:Uncharacterized protein n=1 Tax=Anguilla anguilla TaxID=7936 RepID=A0A0E9W5D7_ANGAN